MQPIEINSIGIFAFAAIGDSILSSSLLTALKRKFPSSKIIIFCSKSNAAIYPLIDSFDQLVILPITNPLESWRLLRQYPVDVIIDTSQWFRMGALYAWLANAKWSIGFSTPSQCRHYAYDEIVQHSDQIHELENFQKLITPLGCSSSQSPALRKDLKNTNKLVLVNPEEPYIIFHPWASGTNCAMREWPEQYWFSLAHELIKQGFKVCISGSSADQDRAQEFAIKINNPAYVMVLAGNASLKELANILVHAKACISVNTGIAHLSAALDVPTIALNGPTNSKRWGIRGGNVINLDVSKEEGGAFLSLGFEYPQNSPYIMDKILDEAVLTHLVNGNKTIFKSNTLQSSL
nr:glycosyltransferase family 9 protein [Polynucleobacter sp. Tro8-14-1]